MNVLPKSANIGKNWKYNMEIKRNRYLQQLIESRQNGFIKVVTGIRRCGKSYRPSVFQNADASRKVYGIQGA